MNFDPNDLLRRFHRALVREIQASNPEHLSAPFSVAEIYQNLVPYRTHRDEIGVEMNADYEHALLRLLAGENDFLTIESRTARQEIREELESPNPNTGLYRDFAAADVRLNPEKIDEALMWDLGQGEDQPVEGVPEDAAPIDGPDAEVLDGEAGLEKEAEEPEVEEILADDVEDVDVEEEEMVPEEMMEEAGVDEVDPVAEVEDMTDKTVEVDPKEVPVELSGQEVPWPAEVEVVLDVEPDAVPSSTDSETMRAEGAPPETCAWCREGLPQRPGVNFCPYCGCSVHLVPCPECGEELELNWRFCIACGTEVSS